MDACWLLIPIKRLRDGKTRLAAQLSRTERADLTLAMVNRIIDLAVESALFTNIVVVSTDPDALSLGRKPGVVSILEKSDGLNNAIEQARQFAASGDADSILILPSDMPNLSLLDLQMLCEAAENGANVVLGPSHDGGTNALLLSPPDRIDPAFGPDSARRHLNRAEEIGATTAIVQTPSLAFDLDRVEDLHRLALAGSDLLEPALTERILFRAATPP